MIQIDLMIGCIFFGVYLISLMAAMRILRTISPSILAILSAILVYLSSLIVIEIVGWHINFFSFSSLYWFLSLSLLMFFGAVYKSISLRMLLHLLNKPGKVDVYEDIFENYIKDQSYTNRLDILVEKKLIEKHKGKTYILTNKGNNFAKKTSLVQNMFSIKSSG